MPEPTDAVAALPARQMTWSYQTWDALRRIRVEYQGIERAFMLAVYITLTQATGNEPAALPLSEAAGVDQATYQRILDGLAAIGLIDRSDGRVVLL